MVAVVVVGAGVLVGGLMRQEMVRGHEDGVGHGHRRFLVPAVADRRERTAKAPVVRRTLAARVASIRAVRSQRLPWRVRPERYLPALSWCPGQRPAQHAACLAVGKTRMSRPNSAMRTSADGCPPIS